MLPDPTEIRERIRKSLTRRVRTANRAAMGPLDEIRRTTIHEGDEGLQLHRADGSESAMDMQTSEAGFSMTREEAEDFDLSVLLKRLDEVGVQMAEQMKRHIYRTISKACDKVGNTVNNKGRPVTPEVLLESLSKLQTDFDDAGNPNIPQIHCHPNMRESLKSAWRTLTTEPAYVAQLKDLIERKRKEWNDREADRVLVG